MGNPNLNGTLVVFDGVPVNVVMGANGLLQLIANHHSGALSSRTSCKHHDPRSSTRVGGFKETNRDTERATGASQRAFVVGDRPRVTRQRLKDSGQLEFALLDGHQETRCAERRLGHGLSGTWSGAILRAQAEHVLDLLRLVLLAPTEDVRLAALCVPNFVYLRLRQTS